MKITAKDLLIKYLDYDLNWKRKDRIDSEPSITRRKQLTSLLQEFEILKENNLDLDNVFRGDFIEERSIEEYNEIIEIIIRKVKEKYPRKSTEELSNSINLSRMFRDLLEFRKEIYKAASSGRSMMVEGFSASYSYSNSLKETFKNKVNTDEIDHVLCLLLDPKRKEVHLEVLVNKYNYPVVDFSEMDRDWRFENF